MEDGSCRVGLGLCCGRIPNVGFDFDPDAPPPPPAPPKEVVYLCWTWRGMARSLSANGLETSLGRGVGGLWVKGKVAEAVRVCANGMGWRSIWHYISSWSSLEGSVVKR